MRGGRRRDTPRAQHHGRGALSGKGRGTMAAEDQETFANLLRRARRTAGLTQEEVAEQAGLSVHSISNLERGAPHVPRDETVRLLAHALELAPAAEAALLGAART